jgi:hypothetical protein
MHGRLAFLLLPSGGQVKTKNPPPYRQWVYQILVNESKPDRRAGQQRVQQQVQIQIAIHGAEFTEISHEVKHLNEPG